MLTYYIDETTGHLLKWNKKLISNIKIGDAVTIEYKNVQIVSKHFDKIGKSQVMIVNNIKDKNIKENIVDNIVYYDKNASPEFNFFKGKLNIDIFKPDEYGNSITYYNPYYEGNIITISTKFFEIDELPKFIAEGLDKIFFLSSKVPQYGIYFALTGEIFKLSAAIITNIKGKTCLADEHLICFRNDDKDKPLLKGKYLCLPDKEIFSYKKYKVLDGRVIPTKNGIPFDESYFILEVDSERREELLDFNFTLESNNLLDGISNKDENSLKKFMDINKNSYNYNIVRKIISFYNCDKFEKIKPLYLRLYGDHKMWFDENFKHITEKLV